MTKTLTITLPEWAAERHITVMAGMELLVYWPYPHDKPPLIKTVRCNFCGWCCENLARSFPTDEKGACVYLEEIGTEKMCSLGTTRPWRCSWSDPILTKYPKAEEVCCIRYEQT